MDKATGYKITLETAAKCLESSVQTDVEIDDTILDNLLYTLQGHKIVGPRIWMGNDAQIQGQFQFRDIFPWDDRSAGPGKAPVPTMILVRDFKYDPRSTHALGCHPVEESDADREAKREFVVRFGVRDEDLVWVTAPDPFRRF